MHSRRKRTDDLSVSGRDLFTADGTKALIRKLQSDPGLTEEFRKEAIEAVKAGAIEKGISVDGRPIIAITPIKKETKEVSDTKPVEVNHMDDAEKAFDAYQKFTNTVALYPKEVALPYTTLGLNGEPSEVAGKVANIISKTLLAAEGAAVDEKRENLFHLHNLLKQIANTGAEAEKLKKALRKGEKQIPPIPKLTEEDKTEIALELGDVLWYVAQTAETIGVPLSKIAGMNVRKLKSRKDRGVIHGNGDNR